MSASLYEQTITIKPLPAATWETKGGLLRLHSASLKRLQTLAHESAPNA
jgi:hypothetical protein